MKVANYTSELILYGGVPTPRGEVIAHLQECGYTSQMVDRYLQGADLATHRGLGLHAAPVVAVDAEEYPGEIWEPIDQETFDRLRAAEAGGVA